jgi:hypothetical protein
MMIMYVLHVEREGYAPEIRGQSYVDNKRELQSRKIRSFRVSHWLERAAIEKGRKVLAVEFISYNELNCNRRVSS